MGPLLSANRRSVLGLRIKQAKSKINYWLAAASYQPHDHSFLMRVYLIYILAFFTAWILAMMFLISDVIANTLAPELRSLGLGLNHVILVCSTLILIFWFLYLFYKTTLRIPLVFTENDAYILCQTPADRRFITMMMFIEKSLKHLFFLGIISATLGIGLFENEVNLGIKMMSFGTLATNGLRPLTILFPLYLLFYGFVWITGISRIQGDTKNKYAVKFLRISILVLSICLLLIASGIFLFSYNLMVYQSFFSFISAPLRAAFFGIGWKKSFPAAIGLSAVSLSILWKYSGSVNLSLAAQETRHIHARRAAFLIGDFDEVNQMKIRERLGSKSTKTKIPSFSGSWSLIWKNIIQSLRSISLSQIWSWFLLIPLTMTVIIFAEIYGYDSSLLPLIFYLVILVGRKSTSLFKRDFQNWWILHSVPVNKEILLLHLTLPSILIVIILIYIAFSTAGIFGLSINFFITLSIPFIVTGLSFSFAFDMLHQADSIILLEGKTPPLGILGLLLSLGIIVIFSVILSLVIKPAFPPLIGVLLLLLVGSSLIMILFHLTKRELKIIGRKPL